MEIFKLINDGSKILEKRNIASHKLELRNFTVKGFKKR